MWVLSLQNLKTFYTTLSETVRPDTVYHFEIATVHLKGISTLCIENKCINEISVTQHFQRA